MGLWDPGSTLSFITFRLAKQLNLQGQPLDLEIFTVGGEKKRIESQRYVIVIIDRNSQEVKIDVLGIDQLSTCKERVDVGGVSQLFSNKEASKVEHPASGTIDLLIGFSYAAFHPVKVEEVALPVAEKIPSMQSVEVMHMLPVVEKICALMQLCDTVFPVPVEAKEFSDTAVRRDEVFIHIQLWDAKCTLPVEAKIFCDAAVRRCVRSTSRGEDTQYAIG